MYDGYIKLHRRILDWDCYSDANTFRLFLHCLLNANWKDGVFKGVKIPRGNLVTSLPKLSQELRLTERQIRTAIEHLKTSGTIAVTTYSKFRIITVLNYEQYQDSDSQNDSQNDTQKVIQMTDKMSGNVSGMCQASDRQTTTIEELKKERSKKKKKKTYRSLVDEYTPDLDLRKALDDFVSMRKDMKGFTVRALELALSKLDKLAQDDQTKIKIVNQSIERSWKGFFPIKQQSAYTTQRQDVLPDYYQQMKTGSEKETAEETDFDREEFEEIRRQLREQEEKK